VLALVLAVLVWAIMWGNIAAEDKFKDVELHPKTSPRFVAYPEGTGRITLKVRGPRRELEEAQARLGSPASVDMPIADLEGKDYERVFLTDVSQLTVPFPPRLLLNFEEGEVAIEVFRLKESVVTFDRPVVDGVPLGMDYTVTLEPQTYPVVGPAHRVGQKIMPDHVDVSRLFPPDRARVFLPDPVVEPVSFNNWRSDDEYGKYRTDVVLPEVKATVRFFATGERSLRNLLVFWGQDGPLDGYEASVTGDLDPGYYSGRFVGAEADLDEVEQNHSSWWFVVRVPRDKLPTGDEPTTTPLPVEYVHTSALDYKRARFEPKEAKTLIVVIRRAP